MRRREIDVTAVSSAAPDVIYRLLVDGATWPSWTPIESFTLEQADDGRPEGVGAIRVFQRGKTVGRDRVVELVTNRRLAYTSESTLPVRDYHASVDLFPGAETTTIRWRASFFPKVPGTGWITERGLRRFLEQCARGLADYAEHASLFRR
jgi:uncharacterized protein YndB with AHSA1/START domain